MNPVERKVIAEFEITMDDDMAADMRDDYFELDIKRKKLVSEKKAANAHFQKQIEEIDKSLNKIIEQQGVMKKFVKDEVIERVNPEKKTAELIYEGKVVKSIALTEDQLGRLAEGELFESETTPATILKEEKNKKKKQDLLTK